MVNVERLTKVLEHIEGNPEEWNQGVWGARTACKTAFCVAGHAAAMFSPGMLKWYETFSHWEVDVVELPDGETLLIYEHARDLLDLTPLEADALFLKLMTHDVVKLRRVVEWLCRRGELKS